MSSWNPLRSSHQVCILAATAALIVIVISAPSRATLGAQPSSPIQPQASRASVPPLPVPGPLAQPRSLKQVGLPVLQTLAEAPPENLQNPEKIALGEKLFFDPRLSVDGTVACATCHDPARAFTDGRPTSVGVKGRVGQRNSPTILNALYNQQQFWDGRADTLEDQAALPITNPDEMGQPNLDAAVAAIAGIPDYQKAFQVAFGKPADSTNLVRAIASYERTLVSFDSPFDRYIAGDASAISDSAKRGWELFNTRALCSRCHAAAKRDVTYFTDFSFHNIGIGILRHHVVPLALQAQRDIQQNDLPAIDQAAISSDFSVLGRFLVTRAAADTASFKTPNLRNVLVTAPYFHDGSQATLWDVIDHYNKGDGLKDPWLDGDIQPLGLSEKDIDDLVAFLASLSSDDYKDFAAKEYARQHALSLTTRPQRDTARAFGPKPPRPQPPSP